MCGPQVYGFVKTEEGTQLMILRNFKRILQRLFETKRGDSATWTCTVCAERFPDGGFQTGVGLERS